MLLTAKKTFFTHDSLPFFLSYHSPDEIGIRPTGHTEMTITKENIKNLVAGIKAGEYAEFKNTYPQVKYVEAALIQSGMFFQSGEDAAIANFDANFDFVKSFCAIQTDVHETAKAKGWWPDNPTDRPLPEVLLLLVTEIAEAAEGLRAGNPPDDKIPEFSSLEAELADVIVRIMDISAALNLRVAAAVLAKTEYNKTRSYKHGGKKF